MKRINLISLYTAIGLCGILLILALIFGENGISDNRVSAIVFIFIYGNFAVPFLVAILGAVLAMEKKVKQAVISFAIGLGVLAVVLGSAPYFNMLLNPTDFENFENDLATPTPERPTIQE